MLLTALAAIAMLATVAISVLLASVAMPVMPSMLDMPIVLVVVLVVVEGRRHLGQLEQSCWCVQGQFEQKRVVSALGCGAVQFAAETRLSLGMSKPCSP